MELCPLLRVITPNLTFQQAYKAQAASALPLTLEMRTALYFTLPPTVTRATTVRISLSWIERADAL